MSSIALAFPRVCRLVLILSLVLLPAILTGCGTPSSSAAAGGAGDDHAGHDHADETSLVRTAWSPDLEVHAEYPPLIVGHPATLTLYLTDLPSGAPVAGGQVQLKWLDQEGQSYARVVREPREPGVYLLEGPPPRAGQWSLRVTAPGGEHSVTLENLQVAASHEHDLHEKDGHTEGDGADPEFGSITMTKEQQWRLRVGAVPAEQGRFTQPLRVAAKVEAPPARRVVVTTPVAGRVTSLADGSLPQLGQRVQAGQPLARVSVPLTGNASELLSAESDLIKAREVLQLAESEMDRATALLAAGAAPQRRVEEARAGLAAARARHQAAGRLVDGSGPARVISAPIDGVVVALEAAPGSFVEAGLPVLTVLDPSLVWVRGHIPENALARLPERPRARLGIHGDLASSCDIEGARLVYLAPEIDPASRTAAVVYEVDNHDGHLRPGQSLGLALDSSVTREGVLVPAAALVDEHGRTVVYVQTGGETFVKRYVQVDGRDNVRCLVTDGLSAGDRVVTGSPWAVKLAAVGSQMPAHGHAH